MRKMIFFTVLLFLGATFSGASAPQKPVSIQAPVISKAAVFEYADRGKINQMDLLLAQVPEILEERDSDGWTPLIHAARFGQVEMVKFLIRHKANVNAKDRHGFTALHQAASYDHVAVIEVLIDNGAKVNDRTEGAVTARRLAISNGNVRAAKTLENRGGLP